MFIRTVLLIHSIVLASSMYIFSQMPNIQVQPTKIHLIQKVSGLSYTDKKSQKVDGRIDYGSLDMNRQDPSTQQTFLELLNAKSKVGLPLVILLIQQATEDGPVFKPYEAYPYLMKCFKEGNASFRRFLFEGASLPTLNCFKDGEHNVSTYPVLFLVWPKQQQAEYIGTLADHKRELALYMPYDKSQMVTDKLTFMHNELDQALKELQSNFQTSFDLTSYIQALRILAKMPATLWVNPAGIYNVIVKFLTLFLAAANRLNATQVKEIYKIIQNHIMQKIQFDSSMREYLAFLLSTQPDLVRQALREIDAWFTTTNDKKLLLIKAIIFIEKGDLEEAEKILTSPDMQNSTYQQDVLLWQKFIDGKKGAGFTQAKEYFDALRTRPFDWENPSRNELNIYFDALLNKAELLLDRTYKTKVKELLQEIKNNNQLPWMNAFQLYRAKKLWNQTQKRN